MKNKVIIILLTSIIFSLNLFSQETKIDLTLKVQDSVRYCNVKVMNADTAVKNITLKFYVKRLFSLLPITEVTTDENGLAESVFPNDLPGDSLGNLIVVAKITEDDNYGTVETSSVINWGLKPKNHKEESGLRSLSAARDKAPMYLIFVSNTIIIGIWGTLIYVFLQLFKIKKNSKKIA